MRQLTLFDINTPQVAYKSFIERPAYLDRHNLDWRQRKCPVCGSYHAYPSCPVCGSARDPYEPIEKHPVIVNCDSGGRV